MSHFVRVPDNLDIVIFEESGIALHTTYNDARCRFNKYPDKSLRFYVDIDEYRYRVKPVVEFYSNHCIEFVIGKEQ